MGEVGVQDLAAWLGQCIDEDEHVARYAIQETTGRWTHRETDWGGGPVVEDDCGALILPTDRSGNAQYPHIAAWDPERVLVECDTKRRIIEMHKPNLNGPSGKETAGGGDWGCQVCDTGFDSCGCVGWGDWPCETLRLMAAAYRDRPGYRADLWAPDGR